MKRKITFDGIKQIVFTLREIIKIIAKTDSKLLIGMFVINALWGITSVPGFYLQKLILDNLLHAVGKPDWRPYLYSIGIIVVISVLLDLTRNVLSSFSNYFRRILSRVFSAKIELMIGQKLSTLDLATIEDSGFQDKFNKIQRESGNRSWGLISPLSDIPNFLIGFISVVVLLIFLSPFVALGVLIFSIPKLIVNSRFIKKDYELDTTLSPKYRMWGWLNYYLVRNRNFMELKILNLSPYLSDKLKTIQTEINKQVMNFQKKRELAGFWGNIPLSLFELVVSIWLIFLVIVEKITIGSFTMYLQALRSAETNLGGLVNAFLEIYENYIYVADLVWFLNLEPKINLDSGNLILDKQSFTIEFKDVWFKYKEKQKWVARGINLKIAPGEKIAVVGLNGAGKSTLIKLLARFYDPQKGEILIDGVNLKNYDLKSWREKLAVLFQEFETYPFSVNDTVGYGDIYRVNKLDDVKEAVKRTGMDKFVEGLPNKYENPLDPEFDQGVKPSIGQMQRFGISRMIFRKNARIVVMDEPTSSVDPEAEEKIFKELVSLAKSKILIFVKKKFSTVRLADRVLVIDDGRSEEHTSELQSPDHLVCRLLLEKKKKKK